MTPRDKNTLAVLWQFFISTPRSASWLSLFTESCGIKLDIMLYASKSNRLNANNGAHTYYYSKEYVVLSD